MEKSVDLYVKSSCSSSRKAKSFLSEKNIPYCIHSLKDGVTKEFVKEILSKTEGISDIVKKGSNEKFENMSMAEFIEEVTKDPTILKSPILIQGEKINIGYNEEEICTFLSRKEKKATFKNLLSAI